MLKPHSEGSTDQTLSENPVTIILKDGSNSNKCLFNRYTKLCVLPKTVENMTELGIQCSKTPCELSWVIVQPGVLEQDGSHALDSLVSINKDKNHAAVEVICDSPEVPAEFSESLILYTNSNYRK